ncbi:glycosyltransferase [Henriciella mobilis]|uniref:Glycosyltransferase n=2 Tax=Henriciella mobilis TaxID=2305467 RepID=A0A399R9G3_9PROT|nr:glycosyltransferase [Henriciella mobilis]
MGEGMRGEPDPAIAGGRAKKGGHEGEWNSVPGPLSALAQSKALSPKLSARSVPSLKQIASFVLMLVLAGWAFHERPDLAGYTLGFLFWFGFFLIVLWRYCFVVAGLFHRFREKPARLPSDVPVVQWPVYSVLIALRDEAAMMPQLAACLRGLDWPADKLEVILLVEADDDATRDAALKAPFPLGTLVLTVPPGKPLTKPRALNYGLAHATGTYVTIYDAEDRPHSGQLKAAYATFLSAPADVLCLQAPLTATNGAAGWVAAQWALEYAVHFNLYLPALAGWGHPIMLGGTSNHFRRADLIAFGGWDAWNVTEDADLGLRAARLGGRTMTISPPTLETAPETLPVWFKQRTRWIKGYIQTWLVCMRNPFRLLRELGLSAWISLQMTLGASILSALLYGPTTVFILVALAFPGDLVDPYSFALFGFGWACSTLGDVLAPGRWRFSRLLATLSRPLYWPLQTLAAFAALYGLAVRPYFWAKTPHQPE